MSRVQSKKNKYTIAGNRMVAAGSGFCFSNNVYVPGGEVYSEQQGDVFYAKDGEMRKNEFKPLFARKSGLIILSALLLVFVCVIGAKLIHQENIKQQIKASTEKTAQYAKDIAQINLKLIEASDVAKICYQAVDKLGMVNSLGAETVYITMNANGTYTTEKTNGHYSTLVSGNR